ncbi:flagellar basal body-associated FliL family protein [Thiomicrorhabdus arctica]|uniref:flagellar basal body-associated FliL family protein n=1 Tax=Thiomicrorhabdus arctica TaxID=131540 RepID=UPI00036A3100|nr:flagellar basal body-associated FliL family protein [Thiomicrorhabdus arctica]
MNSSNPRALATKTMLLILSQIITTFSATSFASSAPDKTGYSTKYKQFDAPSERVPKYFSMEKIVVNFRGEGKAKFLAIDLEFMSYYPQIVETEMEHLRPILKNNIDRLLRNQFYSQLHTPNGPDRLREEILQVARKTLERHQLFPDLLEDVYLERFVMQ